MFLSCFGEPLQQLMLSCNTPLPERKYPGHDSR
jgi:hypothetical protein